MIVCDTSGLLALLDESEAKHTAVKTALEGTQPPYFLPALILVELDYLLKKRAGSSVARRFFDQVVSGAFQLEPFGTEDLAIVTRILDANRGLDLGVADASVVALAGRLGVRQILTLDQRHFRVVQALDGHPFELLPADFWLH